MTLPGLTIEFCGVVTRVDRQPFTIGRDADLVVDESNRFLHRRLLSLTSTGDLWLVSNIGTLLTAAISDPSGRLDAFLAPGAVLPLVLDETVVRFSAGPTAYELSVFLDEPHLARPTVGECADGDATAGRTEMTPDQLRLVLALAEPALQGTAGRAAALPSSVDAARRLGWTTTKFNRKLDNVCQKLTAQGVRGLHGAPGRLAANRRARLVEHALATRLVTRDDLGLIAPRGHDRARTGD